MKTNRLTSARRRAGGVAARPWRFGLLLCLTAAALMLGNARAVDLDPVLRGQWPPFARASALGVAVSGHHAYVAAGEAGLQVIDLSNPAGPQQVGGYDTSGYARGVVVSGHYAHVADGDAGLQVIDVSNPANPQWVAAADTGDAHAGGRRSSRLRRLAVWRIDD
ncbi:MAG: hypothetical protein HS113_04015 [Verrucomicrobiales bacterium]|nr:hypothetical protein [Verrucomicrobiales bacterium]